MPLYTYACVVCNRTDTAIRTVARRAEAPRCPCGTVMLKQLDAPRVLPDYAGYDCPVTGKWIEGRRAHEENLKRTGSRLLEPGENAQALRRQQAEDTALEDRVAETAATIVEGFSPEKKEALAQGFANGLSFDLQRS